MASSSFSSWSSIEWLDFEEEDDDEQEDEAVQDARSATASRTGALALPR